MVSSCPGRYNFLVPALLIHILLAWSSAWPRLIKASSCSESSRADWLQMMVHSPMLFHANMFGQGGLCASHGVSARQEIQQMRLECYWKTLALVAAEVDKMTKNSETPSEELIAAVLILSGHHFEHVSNRASSLRKPEPHPSAIDNYYYCLTKFNYCHTSALKTLVIRRGGIGSIQTQGIAHLICLYVISLSS